MDTKSGIEYCVEAKHKGRSNSELVYELKRSGVDEIDAKEIVRKADLIFLNELKNKADRRLDNNLGFKFGTKLIGWILVIAGVLITVLTYTGIIGSGDSFWIWPWPIIVGAGMIGYGNRKEKQKDELKPKSPYAVWRNDRRRRF